MSRRAAGALVAALALVLFAPAGADEGRFNAQNFRPLGAPQDLVMVSQSRPLSHLSLSAGLFLSFSLDPLVLVRPQSGQRVLNVVSNRLELDAMAAIGLYDWLEIGLIQPLVLFQSSGNLADLGTEGAIQSTALGDLRLTAKLALPGLRRKAEGKGWGGAITFQLDLPTGAQDAFTSDGAVSVLPGLVIDYRFGNGMLIALNGGLWLRPDHELALLQVGSAVTLGAAVEVPVVRRWGVTVIGEAFSNLPFTYLEKPKDLPPVEALLGIRWYSSSGFTLTVGGGGGDCGFGSPSLRFFVSLVWVPSKTREYEAIERFKDPPDPPPANPDPDKDGLIGDKDQCPNEPGPVENNGCPDVDTDKDGIVDRLDKCPVDPGPGAAGGCPRVRIKANKIVILETVHFATDQDIILPESFPVLEEVAHLVLAHPEIRLLVVEGHTDIRASDDYNLELSRRRAGAVMRFFLSQGVEPDRLRAEGFGRRRPITTNDSEAGMAMNRRVEFTIEKLDPTRARTGAGANRPAAAEPMGPPPPHDFDGVLPGRDQVLPRHDTLPTHVLPTVSKHGSNLPDAPTAAPTTKVLPSGSNLPHSKRTGPVRSETPRAKERPAGQTRPDAP